MKQVLILIALPIFLVLGNVASMPSEANYITKKEPFAVVQLFTSQGCSSCPSADRLLDKVKKTYAEENVIVLSYHVDYWNRLGWKDPYSKKEFSTLQEAYGFKFNSRSIYTPQAVVNGSLHFVGSNEAKMNQHLSDFLEVSAENTISISAIEQHRRQLSFSYTVTGYSEDKTLKIALVINERETSVKRGENKGKKLLNSNIVIEEKNIYLSKKEGRTTINLPAIVAENDELSLVGYIQKGDLSITGATMEKVGVKPH